MSKVTKGSQDSIPGGWLQGSHCTPLTPGTCRGDSTLPLTFDVDLHALGHGQPFVIVGLTTEDRSLGQTWRGRRAVRPAAERQVSVYQNPMGGDFPGGVVVKNPLANAADTGSSPGPRRSHMPRSN